MKHSTSTFSVCAGCSKPIKGKGVLIVPPMCEVVLGIASERSYHPGCHKKAVASGQETSSPA